MSSMAFSMKDAKTKLCPVLSSSTKDRRCVGHRCVAWVWLRNDADTSVEDRQGFCGMVPDVD